MKLIKKPYIIVLSILSLVILLATLLLYTGVIWFNNPSKQAYPVRGVDVSKYQGEIDWDILASQDIDFAYIKATEGSTYVDEQFKENWQNANKTSLKVGAYHFFSFGSSGFTQADNFIANVGLQNGNLPPVIDIELYGEYKKQPLSKEDVKKNLDELVAKLEQQYKVKPIFYVTQKSFKLYLQGEYDNYPIWIRNVISTPKLPSGVGWQFWQYSHRKKLKGYSGEEKYIDMNVWHGTQQEFDDWVKISES